jgi:pyruvate-ferredoxin/flavodoxin oxidoreductase
VINASRVAKDSGMGSRINGNFTNLLLCYQQCNSEEEAIEYIKKGIRKSYGRKGEAVVQKNFTAVDKNAGKSVLRSTMPTLSGNKEIVPLSVEGASEFVQQVLSKVIAGEGDELPVSAFPVDGTFPSATTRYEKRGIADMVRLFGIHRSARNVASVSLCARMQPSVLKYTAMDC